MRSYNVRIATYSFGLEQELKPMETGIICSCVLWEYIVQRPGRFC